MRLFCLNHQLSRLTGTSPRRRHCSTGDSVWVCRESDGRCARFRFEDDRSSRIYNVTCSRLRQMARRHLRIAYTESQRLRSVGFYLELNRQMECFCCTRFYFCMSFALLLSWEISAIDVWIKFYSNTSCKRRQKTVS